MSKPDPALLEAIARGAFAKTNVFWLAENPDRTPLDTWDETTDELRRHWLVFAEAALAAIDASGTHRVVAMPNERRTWGATGVKWTGEGK